MKRISICYGCMRKISQQDKSCPYCGFDGSQYSTRFYQLKLGTVLSNRYIVGRMLGEGGFGITYIAWDRNLEVPVAVKEYYPYGLVNRDTTSDNQTVFSIESSKRESFEIGLTKVIEEARRMAKFRDMQGIVTVVDFFRENGTAYIVMEYVRGITCLSYLKQQQDGRIQPQELLSLFRPLIQSLGKIHQSGLIHRDISPDNIMLNEDGELRLLDFGAARDYEDDEKSLSIMLKRGYAPAEQYSSKGNQGPWTDVYALCATMYKLLTGIRPEESLDRLEQDKLLSLSDQNILLPPGVERALLGGLEVYSQNRIQDMETLYTGLYGEQPSQIISQISTGDNLVYVKQTELGRISLEKGQTETIVLNKAGGIRKWQKKLIMIGGFALACTILCIIVCNFFLGDSRETDNEMPSTNLVRETEENQGSYPRVEYQYNSNGDKIEGIGYDENGEILFTYGYQYDENGNLTTHTCYNALGKRSYTEDFDENGNRIRNTSYDTDENVSEIIEFDKDGSILSYQNEATNFSKKYSGVGFIRSEEQQSLLNILEEAADRQGMSVNFRWENKCNELIYSYQYNVVSQLEAESAGATEQFQSKLAAEADVFKRVAADMAANMYGVKNPVCTVELLDSAGRLICSQHFTAE